MAENTELTVPQESTDIIPQTPPTQNLLQNTKALAMINRLSERYANSSMVPDTYRGKPDNCFVALELASRMDVSPVLVMQNLYIVQGKPSWAGQACKALIDGSGKFADSEYVMVGNPADDTWGCYLQAVNVKTGKLVWRFYTVPNAKAAAEIVVVSQVGGKTSLPKEAPRRVHRG